MAKDYYVILGVSPEATLGEIRSAYRRRVKEYHPDRFGSDAGPFRDIQEAWAVLGDPALRRAYDRRHREANPSVRQGAGRPQPAAGPLRSPEPLRRRGGMVGSPAEPLRPESPADDPVEASLLHSFRTYRPSFEDLFERLWSNFSRLDRPKAERIESLRVEMVLSPEQARRGGHLRLSVPALARCPTCGGRGGIDLYECWRCGGEGRIPGEYPVLVSFPPGVYDGYEVSIPLDRFGIGNFYLTLHLRVGAGDE